MNINELNRIEVVEIGNAFEGVSTGNGTFKNILEKVFDKTIRPLTMNGEIVGIDYNSGKVGAEDSIEQEKFSRIYFGKPVMQYVLKSLELLANGKQIKDVVENDDEIKVICKDGEVISIIDNEDDGICDDCYDCDGDCEDCEEYDDYEDDDFEEDEDDDTPQSVIIDKDDLVDFTDASIKKYLRDKYDRYLAKDNNMTISRGCERIYVDNITWGRKR